MTAPGWYPSGPEALYWWDGRAWTARVVLRDGRWVTEEPPPAVHRRRSPGQTLGLVLGLLVLVPLALLLIVSLLAQDSGRGTTSAMVDELDGWELPATVVRADRPDHVEPGELGLSNPSVTRDYRPAAGATLDQATRDLITSLRKQGYRDLEIDETLGMPSASGRCDAVSDCRLDITIDEKLIVVRFAN